MKWSVDDLDLLEEALQDYADTWRDMTPADAKVPQEWYDKHILRIRALKAEIHAKYLEEQYVYNKETKQ